MCLEVIETPADAGTAGFATTVASLLCNELLVEKALPPCVLDLLRRLSVVACVTERR
jgi:hypothetical protein